MMWKTKDVQQQRNRWGECELWQEELHLCHNPPGETNNSGTTSLNPTQALKQTLPGMKEDSLSLMMKINVFNFHLWAEPSDSRIMNPGGNTQPSIYTKINKAAKNRFLRPPNTTTDSQSHCSKINSNITSPIKRGEKWKAWADQQSVYVISAVQHRSTLIRFPVH